MGVLGSLFEDSSAPLVLSDPHGVLRFNVAARAALGDGRRARLEPSCDPARLRCADGGTRELRLLARGGGSALWTLAAPEREELAVDDVELFRQITEHIREVIWLRDLQTSRMLYVNPAYEEIWQRPRSEIYEDPAAFMRSLHEEDRARVLDAYERQHRGESFFDEEYRIVRPSGETRWVWARNFPIRDAGGQIVRVAGIADDITTQKEHEGELERRLAERAERIRQLEQRQAETDRLSASARMVARIAHEINNPIAGIKNCLQLLRYQRDAQREVADLDYIGLAEQEIVRVGRIVHQLLDLHRLDESQTTELRPSELLEGMRVLLEPSARSAEVAIETSVLGDDTRVRLPSGLLRQILYNLLQNAIEASAPGSSVAAEAEVGPDTVWFRVRDEGTGLPQDLLERIFEPLYTSKQDSGGLGLGLSVSRRAAEAMGGSLEVESTPGEGTVFTLVLPRSVEQGPPRSDG